MIEDAVVNCHEVGYLVSALYDGEPVPVEFANHVDACPTCRASLRVYSHMGAELRLLASRKPFAQALPDTLLAQLNSRRPSFGAGRVLVPRFAIALAVGLFVVLTVSLMKLHAQQSRPLWFQFTLDPNSQQVSRTSFRPQHAVQSGYDDKLIWGDGPTNVVATHIAVSAIGDDRVQLAVRSRRYVEANADQIDVNNQLDNLNGHAFTYVPGKPLEIPIEGGGTLVLQGDIVDHQPKFTAFGMPLEPNPDQLILSSPVLISESRVLSNLKGANAIATGVDGQIDLYVPGTGLLRFALQPSSGAIQAHSNWGTLDFQLNGRDYSVLATSPICGGDQPRTVWVRNDAGFVPQENGLKLGFLSASAF